MNHKAKAIQLLGEKITKKLDDTHIKSATYPNGYNQMHSKAVEVVVGLLGKIEELEKWQRDMENSNEVILKN